MSNLAIISDYSYIPPKVVTNDDLSKIMDTSDEWITTRTGIKQRHISINENTSDLATKVANGLLFNSGIKAEEIDYIIVATMSADNTTPSTAALVQGRINAVNAMAFDISAACSGFVYGFDVMSKLLMTPNKRYGMLIGSEVISKILDWNDRSSAVLFGDGAAGVIIDSQSQEFPDAKVLSEDMRTYGDVKGSLVAGTTVPLTEFPDNSNHKFAPFSMVGRDVYKFSTHAVPESIEIAVKKAGLTLDDVDHFLLHQANIRIIESIAKRMKQPMDKFPHNIENYGNISAACMPNLLHELNQQSVIKRGEIVVLCGYGGGLTVGTMVIKY